MEEFKVTQGQGSFNPEQTPDYVRSFDEALSLYRSNQKLYLSSVDDQSQQAIRDEAYKLNRLEQLSEYSSTLLSDLVDFQDKRNKYQEGVGYAQKLREGLTPDERLGLTAQEDALATGQEEANKTADAYLANGGDQVNAQAIRNTGGWAGYGRFKASLQLSAQEFPGVLEEAKASGFTVDVGGRPMTADEAETREEYAAWQDGVVAAFTSQFAGANTAVVTEKLLEPMRKQLGLDAATWADERAKELKAEAKEERLNGLLGDIKGNGPNLYQWFSTFPGNKREAREELESSLITLMDAGLITEDEALRVYEEQTIIKDGKRQTMADAFPTQFGLFQDKIAKATAKENEEYQTVQKNEAASVARKLESIGQGNLSNAQIAEMEDQYQGNPHVLAELDRYKTREDISDRDADLYLESLYRSGDLTAEEVLRFDKKQQDKWLSKVEQDATFASELDNDLVEDYAEAAARESVGLEQGDVTTKSNKYLRAFGKAKEIYKDAYLRARRRGQDDATAHTYAQQELERKSKKKTDGTFPLLVRPKQVTLGNTVQEARQWMSKNPSKVNTELLPNSQQYLDEAYEYLRTGRGSMPGFYTALAAGQPYTAEELVIKQAELAGKDVKQFKDNPYRKERVKLPPELQRKVVVQPSAGRFAQATVQSAATGDTKYFLDTVASKESTSYGGYDAYNLGGSDGGHTAHGSGNSAEDGRFGKPISQLTIGEIKQLHREGKLWAAGRYQFIAPTFAEVAPMTGLPDSQVFDAKTQDLFAITRLIQRASWGSLKKGLKSEWIGLNYLRGPEYQRLVQAAYGIVDNNK